MSTEGKVPAGYYKGRCIAGSEQYGLSKNGNDQIAVDISIPALERTFTTFLAMTDDAAPYSIDRLRAAGWKGDDLTKLAGIDANEVDVQISYENYQGKEQLKVQIATGGGTVKLAKVMDEKQKRSMQARFAGLLKGGATPPKPAPKAKGGDMPSDERFGDGGDVPNF